MTDVSVHEHLDPPLLILRDLGLATLAALAPLEKLARAHQVVLGRSKFDSTSRTASTRP